METQSYTREATGRVLSPYLMMNALYDNADGPADAKFAVGIPWAVGDARSLNDEQKVAFSRSGGHLTLTKQFSSSGIWVVRYAQKQAGSGLCS